MENTEYTETNESVLPALAELSGWQEIDPPTEEQEFNDKSIIGNWNGEPIRAGIKIETITDNETCVEDVFRTSCYDVHLKIETVGRQLAMGMVKVSEADGYSQE
jgi:hypothetical protein